MKHFDPNNINYLEISGWLNSLKTGRVEDYYGRPLPWYCFPAIEFIEDKIGKNFRVFEYGSGYSTRWYAERVQQVISVEHDKSFFHSLKDSLPSNTTLSLVEDLSKYAQEILKYEDNYFDVVVIDGRCREACAYLSYRKLKREGFIVFDNSDRADSDRAIQFLMAQGFNRIDFYGLVAMQTFKTCTSLFLKSDKLLKSNSLPSQKRSCLGISCANWEAWVEQQDHNILKARTEARIKEREYAILACQEAIRRDPECVSLSEHLENLMRDSEKVTSSTPLRLPFSPLSRPTETSFQTHSVALETVSQSKKIFHKKSFLLESLQRFKEYQWPIKIVVGAGGITVPPGWLATDADVLNLLKPDEWQQYFSKSSLEVILAEHVWEHLTKEEGIVAAKTGYDYLKKGGYLRVAVPDGFHPSPQYVNWVKPGGVGPGSDDHKILYNYRTLTEVFEAVGFQVELLEYFDEQGNFHFNEWDILGGLIRRSKRFDERNQGGKLSYTSIIIDARKCAD